MLTTHNAHAAASVDDDDDAASDDDHYDHEAAMSLDEMRLIELSLSTCLVCWLCSSRCKLIRQKHSFKRIDTCPAALTTTVTLTVSLVALESLENARYIIEFVGLTQSGLICIELTDKYAKEKEESGEGVLQRGNQLTAIWPLAGSYTAEAA